MAQSETLGVVGGGQMGRGIAQVAAASGVHVVLVDVNLELATVGVKRIGDELSKLVEKGKVPVSVRETALQNLKPAGAIADLKACTFAIEAVPEDIALKQKVFAELDRTLPKGAVLASNTSSISLTRIASFTSRPDAVIGMHFMNPVPRMALVEVIRALQTSEATFERTRALAAVLNKEVVVAKDAPGFVVNRLLLPLINEACFALQEGLASAEDIDRGVKLGLSHPMGPLELADLIGLDTCLAIAEILHRDLGEDKYRPAALLRNYVAAGWLGRKSGRGFYNYAS